MIDKRTWKEFRDTKLLWWVNRTLHLFGWAIVFATDEDDKLVDVFPARVKFRGFDQEIETDGFKGLSIYLLNNIKELEKETYE